MYVINMDCVSPTIENVISFIGPQTCCGCIMLWARQWFPLTNPSEKVKL